MTVTELTSSLKLKQMFRYKYNSLRSFRCREGLCLI